MGDHQDTWSGPKKLEAAVGALGFLADPTGLKILVEIDFVGGHLLGGGVALIRTEVIDRCCG